MIIALHEVSLYLSVESHSEIIYTQCLKSSLYLKNDYKLIGHNAGKWKYDGY